MTSAGIGGAFAGAGPADQVVPDLLERDFTASAPDRRYVGDITYLPTGDGRFRYLATVIDLPSRRLAGWSIADRMGTEVVIDALRAAAADARCNRKTPDNV
ncbi:integrase [Planomonospora sphaerica]|uniref:Integrase n=1 Tax=Planomonospora sphaerica TaxID=161355 RepID=A0A171DQA4_9ACTN|nr:integrase [Planomonospora sphaerica]